MKIRIQDHSVRFRVTVLEAETLLARGKIEACAEMYSSMTKACIGRFVYGITVDHEKAESSCEMNPGSIFLILTRQDAITLNDPSHEGVYLRHEVQLDEGRIHRFTAFVEKDRPTTKCSKPDEWIYERALQSNLKEKEFVQA